MVRPKNLNLVLSGRALVERSSQGIRPRALVSVPTSSPSTYGLRLAPIVVATMCAGTFAARVALLLS